MTIAATPNTEPRTRRWTREEFYKLAEDGWFRGQRVLLLEGEIIQLPAMKHPHAWAVSRAADVLRRAFGAAHWVREDKPLNAADDSDPEPDVAVTERSMDAYSDHPTTAVLVVEVSDTTLRLDRRKAAVYAEAGVNEYWILNLSERQLEVHRAPDVTTRSYREHWIVSADGSIAPLLKPEQAISVKEFLP